MLTCIHGAHRNYKINSNRNDSIRRNAPYFYILQLKNIAKHRDKTLYLCLKDA